jgi:hypothetical protein
MIVLLVLTSLPAFAQFAIETAPGVRSYGGETMSVETMPGHHRFSGAVEGSVTEIMPGVSHYNLRPSIDAELKQTFAAESQWRAQRNAEMERDQADRHRRDRQIEDRIHSYGR